MRRPKRTFHDRDEREGSHKKHRYEPITLVPPAEEEEEEEEDVQNPNGVFEQTFPPERLEELESLGLPAPRKRCFGCVMLGERDNTAIPYEEYVELIEMQRQSIGRVDVINLAKKMAKKYAQLRARVNSKLIDGEKPLPPWNASSILEHLRYHNQDPEMQMIVLLDEVFRIRRVTYEALFEENVVTGKKRPNEKTLAMYEKVCKLQLLLYKQDVSKHAFYSNGAFVEPKNLKQGVMSSNTKNLVTYWH